MRTKAIDYNVLVWVFFCSVGITDNTDLMRASLLCMECSKIGATLENVKDSSGYRSCLYDLPDSCLTDEYITKIIEFNV
jgi:hypothetical protein